MQTVFSFNTLRLLGECDVEITFTETTVYANVNGHITSITAKELLSNDWGFRFGINPSGDDIKFSEFIIINL